MTESRNKARCPLVMSELADKTFRPCAMEFMVPSCPFALRSPSSESQRLGIGWIGILIRGHNMETAARHVVDIEAMMVNEIWRVSLPMLKLAIPSPTIPLLGGCEAVR